MMKYPYAIISAAAATVTAIVRSVIGDSSTSVESDPDAASAVPPITRKMVERYVYIGGTVTEIADRFLVDESYIRTQFADVLRSVGALRKLTLRGWQWDLGRKLNATILIWFGRNELGQTTNPGKPDDPMPEIYDE
jgi:hypothetical protein